MYFKASEARLRSVGGCPDAGMSRSLRRCHSAAAGRDRGGNLCWYSSGVTIAAVCAALGVSVGVGASVCRERWGCASVHTLYIYIYIGIYLSVYICLYICLFVLIYTGMCTDIYPCMGIDVSTDVCAHPHSPAPGRPQAHLRCPLHRPVPLPPPGTSPPSPGGTGRPSDVRRLRSAPAHGGRGEAAEVAERSGAKPRF